MKKIYFVLFAILCTIVFSCTDNLISTDLDSHKNSVTSELRVFVKESRLIGPELSDVSWSVGLRKSGENNTIPGKNENGYYLFSGLSDGTYNITVSGKIDEVEKFTGSAQVTIVNGNSVSVNVPIVATKNLDAEVQSTGYATITMDMSGKLLSLLNSMGEKPYFSSVLVAGDNYYMASLVKQNLDDQDNIDSIEFLDNQKVEFVDNISSQTVTTEIPTGYYYLTFSGLERFNYTIKLKDNLVEIGDGLTTNIVLTQNDYELVQWNSDSQGMPTVFYVDNSDNQSDDNYIFGTTLSNPLGFRNIDDNISGTFYLISDVEAYKEDENRFSGIEGSTITSFGSKIFSIINNNENFSLKFEHTFLKNIKLTNTTGNGFCLPQCPVDGTVILDTPIVQDSDTDSTVLMSKSSNLVIGQKFSGELGICLSFEDWNIGDTVVTFENGVKPSNSNFYISEDADMPTGFASMFYIDDNGKLAQYDATSQWVNFAWNSGEPCLITQTQAKNKTYTRIIDSTGRYLFDFNGISTYDEENQTWYFIANGSDANGNTVSSLYKVSASTEYTDTVTPEKICEVKLDETGHTSINVQDIYIYNGKIYLCNLFNATYEVYVSNLNDIDFGWNVLHSTIDTVTALLVENDVIYIATTTSVDNFGVTHSEIWRYKWDSDLGYTTAVDTYYQNGKNIPVPYYLTQNDKSLTITDDLSSYSNLPAPTLRITDLYSDGTSVYGLLANYIETNNDNANSNVYMRGSVLKLQENASTVNSIHYGLRNSFAISDIPTAKQYFILPRKIVGIMNKKLIIADDGVIPDRTDCNLDRFILFDLDGAISEKIDVNVSFKTSGSTSGFATNTLF